MDGYDALIFETYYKDKKVYTLEDAACAWVGISPKRDLTPKSYDEIPQEIRHRFNVILDILCKACKDGILNYSSPVSTIKSFRLMGSIIDLGEEIKSMFPFPVSSTSRLFCVSVDDLRSFAISINQKPPCLFPQEQRAIFSDDFRTANIGGKLFHITVQQAQVFEMLCDAPKEMPDILVETIFSNIGYKTETNLKKAVFKSNKELYDLTIESKKKGYVRLKENVKP